MKSNQSYTFDTVREAIQRGDAEFVQKAIDAGFDPNTEDSQACTPLIFAAQFQQPAIVRLLLKHGADPCHKDATGYDAAGTAAFHGEWRMGAYTEASTEIQAILREHAQPRRPGLVGWLKGLFGA